MKKLIKISLLSAMVCSSSLVASDILAKVNGHNITKQDAQEFVKATAPQMNYAQLPAKQKEMVLQRLIEKELFKEQAMKDKIENTPEFKEALAKVKDELAVNVWMKQQLDKTVVSDSEAKEFYNKNIDKFKKPATIHARHILVKDEKTAKEIIKQLSSLKGDALKTKFIELAKTKSVGPTGKNGGDLGTFAKGQMVPEFSKVAWDLNVGEITKIPVKTKFGYHVIYLEGKNNSETIPYDAIKDRIVGTLKQKQFALKMAQMTKELKSKAKIEMSK
jgi:parvulin-like peptidyl-prolyl isomerase